MTVRLSDGPPIPRCLGARRRLPGFRRLPDRYIHQPWRMPAEVQAEAGCVIDRDYPAPVVDHAQARLRALEAYRRAAEKQGL